MDKIFLEKPISEMLSEIRFSTTFSFKDAKEVPLTMEQLQSALTDVDSRLRLKLKSGVCSQVLKEQLAIHYFQLGEKFGDEIHRYHYQTILDTIEANENGHAVNIRDFSRNDFLKGFKHIHHNSITYTKHNVQECWKKKCKGKDEVVFQNQLLNEVYLELIKTHTEEFARQKSLGVLLGKIHDECVFRDFKDKTGEWIICVFKNDRWFYLCLAAHKEGDDAIVEKVKRAVEEFPELR